MNIQDYFYNKFKTEGFGEFVVGRDKSDPRLTIKVWRGYDRYRYGFEDPSREEKLYIAFLKLLLQYNKEHNAHLTSDDFTYIDSAENIFEIKFNDVKYVPIEEWEEYDN